MSTSNAPLMPVALRYGLIGGLIYIVWSLIKNMSGLATNPMAGLGDILVYGYTVFAAINTLRADQGEQITFGRSLGVGTLACAVLGVLAGLFAYTYYNFIDPSAVDELVQMSVEMVEKFGGDEDIMEKTADDVKNGFTLPRSLLSGIGTSTIFGFLVSLIAGAIMKKEAPLV